MNFSGYLPPKCSTAPLPGPPYNGIKQRRPKDRDKHNTRVPLYELGDDIWLFLEQLSGFFQRQQPPPADTEKHTILMDRLSNEAMTEYNDNTPTLVNKKKSYDIAIRRLCHIFGPADPISHFTSLLSTMRQNNTTADGHLSNLWRTWRAYTLHLYTMNPNEVLPADVQFVNYFIAGLNEQEKLHITDAHLTNPFTGYIALHSYMFQRRHIWASLQTQHQQSLQLDRNLNTHIHKDRQALLDSNRNQYNKQSEQTESIADTLKATMEQFANTISTSLNTITRAVQETREQKEQPPWTSMSLNNHERYHQSHTNHERYLNNLGTYRETHRTQSRPKHRSHGYDAYEPQYHSHLNSHTAYDPRDHTHHRRTDYYDDNESTRGIPTSYLNYMHDNSRGRSRSPHDNRGHNTTGRSRTPSPSGRTNSCFGCDSPLAPPNG